MRGTAFCHTCGCNKLMFTVVASLNPFRQRRLLDFIFDYRVYAVSGSYRVGMVCIVSAMYTSKQSLHQA